MEHFAGLDVSVKATRSVGAVFGLTCAKYQSGEVDWDGRISRLVEHDPRHLISTARSFDKNGPLVDAFRRGLAENASRRPQRRHRVSVG